MVSEGVQGRRPSRSGGGEVRGCEPRCRVVGGGRTHRVVI